MPISKKKRQAVYEKYNGLCAYTGNPLGDDWQVDHVTPKFYYALGLRSGDPDDIQNLLPAIKIINHYKRSLDLEEWREYITKLHHRLAKLPKKTSVPRTERRIKYMMQISELFGVTPDTPFCGKFFFEKNTH